MKYYRKKRTSRRIFRRKFFRSKKARSNRIFRKFIRRRAIRPELKWAIVTATSNNIPPSGAITFAITPASIPQGPEPRNRIGSQVNFVKIDLTVKYVNNSSTLVAAPVLSTGHIRAVVWTPRVDYNDSLVYMNQNLTSVSMLDYNNITVLRDNVFTLSPPYMREAVQNDIAAGPRDNAIIKRYSIKFPRKVFFTQFSTTVDQEKYSCYISVYSADLDAYYTFTSRTWFYDA